MTPYVAIKVCFKKNSYTFATVYTRKFVTVFLNQTLVSGLSIHGGLYWDLHKVSNGENTSNIIKVKYYPAQHYTWSFQIQPSKPTHHPEFYWIQNIYFLFHFFSLCWDHLIAQNLDCWYSVKTLWIYKFAVIGPSFQLMKLQSFRQV